MSGRTLRTRCACGWESTGPEADVIAATLDHGRRKWCDMATCGNRAKVARHREKSRRETVAGGDQGDAPADEIAAAG
jgi:hypothetical protein